MENNKKLKEQIKLKIAISEIEDEENEVMNKKNFGIANKIAAVVCLCLLTSGIVFAKDIQEYIINKFKLGKGFQTAMENGYIAETNNDYISCNTNVVSPQSEELLNDINLGIKINTYLIDNSNLSLEIKYKYYNNLK